MRKSVWRWLWCVLRGHEVQRGWVLDFDAIGEVRPGMLVPCRYAWYCFTCGRGD